MFNAIAKPFGILMMWLYELCKNYGVAVILFALAVKLILLPFQMKSKRGTMQSTRIQPKIQELQKKHGANKQKLNEEVAKLYKEEGVNPASGCLWGFLPLPILLALYQAIRYPLTIMMGIAADAINVGGPIYTKLAELGYPHPEKVGAYEQISLTQFIHKHWQSLEGMFDKLRDIDYSFLGMNLGATPSWKVWEFDWSDVKVWGSQILLFLIPVLSAGLTLAQSIIMRKMQPPTPTADGQPGAGSMKSMMYLMPIMSLYFAFVMPAALGVYWIAQALLGTAQDIWLTKRYTRIMDAEDEVRGRDRAAKEAELERKRLETERLKAENKTEANPNTSKKKQELADKKEREAKAAEWEKAHATEKKEQSDEPSRVDNRRYARGRAYDPERFGEEATESAEEPEEEELIEEFVEETEVTDVEDADGEE
ncbi:MAG: membrane protein insertase YidC [Oscillospiraceae bacterium]|jgi:YidC/Oxa1 family membrane protein insertase|nr:membrane protein insertase YidC [Oscillospiraceae bacterium]